MRSLVPVFCAVIVFAVAGYAAAPFLSVEIQVSPATIVRDASCNWVTIHTDIARSTVEAETVTVRIPGNELLRDDLYLDSDARGNLVVKTAFVNVAPYVEPPSAEIVLTGMTKDGVEFGGSATVRVK